MIYRTIAILALIGGASCGIHATSDPIRVDHYVHIDYDAIAAYCQTVCRADKTCFDACFTKLSQYPTTP